jgi:hypothetical protein
MSRDRLLIFGALALLLLFGAWYFTIAAAEAGFSLMVAPVIFSFTTFIASWFVFKIGLRWRVSGIIVIATALIGIGLVGIWQGIPVHRTFTAAVWFLLPSFAGLGILIENRLEIGWRFSNWQAVWLIAAGIGLYFIVRSIAIKISGGLIFDTTWVNLSGLSISSPIDANQSEISLIRMCPFLWWR